MIAKSAGSGRGDGDPVEEIGYREPGPGFVLQGGEQGVPAGIAEVEGDPGRRGSTGRATQAWPSSRCWRIPRCAVAPASPCASDLVAFDIGGDGALSSRRIWAQLGEGVPDGICTDEQNAVWYADVPNKRCVRVAEGGSVLQTVELDRGGFACALGGPGGSTLFIVAAEWQGMTKAEMVTPGSGQVLVTDVDVPGAGWP